MTQKKKTIAVLLVVMVVFSALSTAFCASAAGQMCTLTIELIGDGSVSDGTTSVSAPSVFVAEYPVGSTVSLRATPGTDKETVGWIYTATDRVLSFTDSYSFAAGSDTYLYVLFEDTEAVAAQNGVHQVMYLSEGGNIMFNGTLPLNDTSYYESEVASLSLFSNGKTWTGWDKTPEEVAASSGRVFVRPTYSEEVESYIITTIVGETVSTRQVAYDDTSFAISAPETLNGEPFSYWLAVYDETQPNMHDTIASYNRIHGVVAVMPMTFRAVYGEEVTTGAVSRIIGEKHDFEKTSISFYSARSVTAEYSVIDSGILFTRDPAVGNVESRFVLENVDNSTIRKSPTVKDKNKPEGVHILTNTGWRAVKDGTTDQYYYPLLYVRSYLMVRDADGNTTTIYSVPYCADYVNEAFVGVIEDNPHPDPFG